MKYRLIKEYPGSPKLGVKIIPTNEKFFENLYSIEECKNKTSILNTVNNPENYPEFWELVVEKDYEILSLKSIHSTTVIDYKNGGGSYTKGGFETIYKSKNKWIESFLASKVWIIYSVKRLSDSKIFTIGDYINIHSNNPCCEKGTIVDFSFITDINNISHVKQPLFTTEDGVDIFKGDKVYYIETDDTPENSFKVNEYTIQYSGRFLSDNTLHSFSTKEKAEEYILLNKPVLSLKEVNDIINHKCRIKTKLHNLVKSKIQQSV